MTGLPCKHFLAIFNNFPQWQWTSLATRYREHPNISLDHSLITIIPDNNPNSDDTPSLCTFKTDNSNYDGNNIEKSQKLNAFQLEKNIEKEGKKCKDILKQLATMTYNVENPTALSETISALKLSLNNLAKHRMFDEKENIGISCTNQQTNLIHNQPVGDHNNQKTCEAKSSKYLPLPIRPKKKKYTQGW